MFSRPKGNECNRVGNVGICVLLKFENNLELSMTSVFIDPVK